MTSRGRREAGEGARPPMPRMASTWAAVILLVLVPLVGGCSTAHQPGRAGPGRPPGSTAGRGGLRALASAYLAIAEPANRRLDTEVDGFTDHEHHDLPAAEAALRGEAATERRFDRLLREIPLPPPLAATALALIRANERRAALTGAQARSSSVARLVSFDGRHRAADAAVEAQVRILRRDLGLPPPADS
ncbi:MAG TPA: hypothetical protein VF933_09425 [Streptosporangiaceae bacterium]